MLQHLLNLAEFMEHDDYLLFEPRVLASLAYKCRAYAKALHYGETQFFMSAPSKAIIENLIHLNVHLQQYEAANGIRSFAKSHGWVAGQHLYHDLSNWQEAEELNESLRD